MHLSNVETKIFQCIIEYSASIFSIVVKHSHFSYVFFRRLWKRRNYILFNFCKLLFRPRYLSFRIRTQNGIRIQVVKLLYIEANISECLFASKQINSLIRLFRIETNR
jgi:hypothetical protein